MLWVIGGGFGIEVDIKKRRSLRREPIHPFLASWGDRSGGPPSDPSPRHLTAMRGMVYSTQVERASTRHPFIFPGTRGTFGILRPCRSSCHMS